MAETGNIQKMAELAGDSIFTVFGWRRAQLMNQNWECEEKQKHHKLRKPGTHPTDAVFIYTDPYSGFEDYVNADLKSYAKGTLQTANLAKLIREVGHAVECANKSAAWKALYVDESRNHSVIGLVFIYNHDGGYDKDFANELENLPPSHFDLSPLMYVGVVGPARVIYLNSVAADIKDLAFRKLIPEQQHCRFQFPHLNRTPAIHPKSGAVPLPALLSPLIVLSYESPANGASPTPGAAQRGAVAYYDGAGESVDEFKYLLDYFFKYQIANETAPVMIRQTFQHKGAPAIFEKAKREYARDYWPASGGSERDCRAILDNITLKKVQSVVPSFSDTELGMTPTQP
jgi:hypothetical protein